MNTQAIHTSIVGRYCGVVAEAFIEPVILAQLADIPQLLAADNAERLSQGADYVVKVMLEDSTGSQPITIKVFKRQNRLKDWHDRRHKSKAERSFRAAIYLQQQGIGTPAPIAWLDRWENGRLLESYYLCRYEPAPCFRDALADIYYNRRDNEPLMDLLHAVAPAVRAMHDAGFMHGDMGNQNILLPRDADGRWAQPQFIDLNRCQIKPEGLSEKERAFDLSRIALPGAYLKIFKTIYSQHQDIPPALDKHEKHYRWRFALHRGSRKLRHPLRYWKKRHEQPNHPTYPSPKDIWLWDDKSAQPMIVLGRKEKHRYRNWGYMIGLLLRGCFTLPLLSLRYRKLVSKSYQQPVTMAGRIGVALHPRANYIAKEIPLLQQLGMPPVLIRIGHHETPEQRQCALALIDQLHAQGVELMLAVLQDRQAIVQPDSWKVFLHEVIGHVADKVAHIEISHAGNRVKWGIWSAREYAQLLQPALELQTQYPKIRLTGPACIDFEYLPVMAALGAIPKGQRLAALSHLLYVDRRGAPENKQGKFSTLGKCALLKALAQHSNRCEDKVIISEVNWPVKYTGIWSPIGCPYETPKWRRQEPGETEEVYAWYMLRYLAITLCSGHVDQVFWWRLSAHGYGLVDDKDGFRLRPAFYALQVLLQLIGNAKFIRRLDTREGHYLLQFEQGEKQIFMTWLDESLANEELTDIHYDKALDYLGKPLTLPVLSGAPIYLLASKS